jgi:hypothetical protein
MLRCPTLIAVLALSPALAACGSEVPQAPAKVTPSEAKALDEAAKMLDARRLPPEALPSDAPTAEMTGDAAVARP